MRKMLLSIITIFTLLNIGCAQNKNQQFKPPLKSVFDTYRNKFDTLDYGVIALYKNKQGEIYKDSMGWSAPNIKMTTDKVFNIGSTTKTFIAVLILQEIEKGTLSLNDTLAKFFPPGFVDTSNLDLGITIENLLMHTSGLGEVAIDSMVNPAFDNPYSKYNNAIKFDFLPKPRGPKNSQPDYCSTNYILLGNILTVINDKPYSEILKERIFKACDMEHSYAYFSKSIPNVAHPFFKGEDLFPYVNFRFYLFNNFSTGSISSTLDDLNKFFSYLYSGKFFKNKKMLNLMMTYGDKSYDGMGLSIEKKIIKGKDTIQFYGHAGDNLSFTSRNYYNPETGEQVIILTNEFITNEDFLPEFIDELLEKLVD